MKNLFNGFHKLNSLQYLRALCAIAVVMFHAEGGANKYWQSTTKLSMFNWGYLGVPMFFCLSGFVIAYSGYLRPKRWWEFFYLRLARIYPAYLATAFIFLGCVILLPAGTFNSVPNLSMDQLAKTLFFDFGRSGGYVYVGWTLFYELVFYLCFCFVVFRFPAVAKSKYFYYGVAFALIVCYLLGATRIADFLIGISVFLFVSKSLDKSNALPFYALIASLALAVFFHPIGLFCALVILCLLALEDVAPSAFHFKPFLVMGDSSYSIYLIQVLTVSASLKVAKWIVLALPAFASSYFLFYFLVIAFAFSSTIVVGVFMRKYLEKPSYKYLLNLKNKSNFFSRVGFRNTNA